MMFSPTTGHCSRIYQQHMILEVLYTKARYIYPMILFLMSLIHSPKSGQLGQYLQTPLYGHAMFHGNTTSSNLEDMIAMLLIKSGDLTQQPMFGQD